MTGYSCSGDSSREKSGTQYNDSSPKSGPAVPVREQKPLLYVNQYGFLPDSTKFVIAEAIAENEYAIYRADNDKVWFTALFYHIHGYDGKPHSLKRGDFSLFHEQGHYYLLAGDSGYTDEFLWAAAAMFCMEW
ncbi:MAG: hypothetical protein JW874_07850 [Spirochaetales bacterium]|nr:hypothetical protein [Spirochaetales bacterium]